MNRSIISLVCIFFALFHSQVYAEDLLTEANESYLAGEQSTTVSERQNSFNNALKIYLELEKEYHPISGNGNLFFNIGNTYFNLEEYPLALLYYYRAQRLMPRNVSLVHNLKAAQDKLGVVEVAENSVFQPILFFHYYFSFPERMQIFAALMVLVICLASLHVWFPNPWNKVLAIIAISCAIIMFASLCYTNYFKDIEGVTIRSSLLYRAAGTNYATLTDDPLLSGMRIRVVETVDDGHWLKIITSTGELGFIPASAVRLM